MSHTHVKITRTRASLTFAQPNTRDADQAIRAVLSVLAQAPLAATLPRGPVPPKRIRSRRGER